MQFIRVLRLYIIFYISIVLFCLGVGGVRVGGVCVCVWMHVYMHVCIMCVSNHDKSKRNAFKYLDI